MEKSRFLVEEARFFYHVMEDGVWVVHQVVWGVELNHLPLVQHQDPETSRGHGQCLDLVTCLNALLARCML